MILAIIWGLLTSAAVVAVGTLGSYLFYEPPIRTVGNVVIYDAATIGGLILFAVIGFIAGFTTAREQRPPR